MGVTREAEVSGRLAGRRRTPRARRVSVDSEGPTTQVVCRIQPASQRSVDAGSIPGQPAVAARPVHLSLGRWWAQKPAWSAWVGPSVLQGAQPSLARPVGAPRGARKPRKCLQADAGRRLSLSPSGPARPVPRGGIRATKSYLFSTPRNSWQKSLELLRPEWRSVLVARGNACRCRAQSLAAASRRKFILWHGLMVEMFPRSRLV